MSTPQRAERTRNSWAREKRSAVEYIEEIILALGRHGMTSEARALGMKRYQQLHGFLRNKNRRGIHPLFLYRIARRYGLPRETLDFKHRPIGDVVMGRIPEANVPKDSSG